MRVIVLGAGLLGVTSAYFLQQLGHEVTVIDRQGAPGAETSFANGGQISVSHAEPWANPSAPLKVLQWLGQEDAPLLFRIRADMRQWLWGLQFLRECTPARTRHNIEQIVRLGTYSRSVLQQLRADTGIQYDQRTQGILHFYTNQKEFDGALAPAEQMRGLGCERQVISADEAVRTVAEAAGYVDPEGHIKPWLNELAFAPVDYSEEGGVDEWSKDMGVGALYFSQQAVARLAPRAGFQFEGMPFPEQLKKVQAAMAEGDERARKIYETIGVHFGYAIAHYARFYDIRNLLFLGRVASGDGGQIIIDKAEEVLRTEFPELISWWAEHGFEVLEPAPHGVWMGRDDARAVGGLQGGAAPARAARRTARAVRAHRSSSAPQQQLVDAQQPPAGQRAAPRPAPD